MQPFLGWVLISTRQGVFWGSFWESEPASGSSRVRVSCYPRFSPRHTPEGIVPTLSGYLWVCPLFLFVGGQGMRAPAHQGPLPSPGWLGCCPHQLHTITSLLLEWGKGVPAPSPPAQPPWIVCPFSRGGEKSPSQCIPPLCLASAQLSPNISASAPAPSPFRLISLDLGMWRGRKEAPRPEKGQVSFPMRGQSHTRRRRHSLGAGR